MTQATAGVDELVDDIRGAVEAFVSGKVASDVHEQDPVVGSFAGRLADLEGLGFLEVGAPSAVGGAGLLGEVAVVQAVAAAWGSLALAVADTFVLARATRLLDLPARPVALLSVQAHGVRGIKRDPDGSLGTVRGFVQAQDASVDATVLLLGPALDATGLWVGPAGAGVNVLEPHVQDGFRALARWTGSHDGTGLTRHDRPDVATELALAQATLYSAAGVGVAAAARRSAVGYALDRGQFGHLIGFYGEIQMLLAKADAQIASLAGTVERVARDFDRGNWSPVDAARLALSIPPGVIEVCDRSQHVFGGYGQMAEYPVGRHVRDGRELALLSMHRSEAAAVIAAATGLPGAGTV